MIHIRNVAIAILAIVLSGVLAGAAYAAKGGNGGGGGGGKPGGGGEEPTGCESVGPNNYFPTTVYRKSSGRRKNQHWSIGFGSANGSCKQIIIDFPPGQHGGLKPSFWVNPDGTGGLLAWSDKGEQSTTNPVRLQVASFSIDRSGDAPSVSLAAASTAFTVQPESYRWAGVKGHALSTDGKCLAYITDTLTHEELHSVDVSGNGSCGWVGSISLPPPEPDTFPDGLQKPRWSPDDQSIFAEIIRYEFPGDTSGAWGIVRVDLNSGVLTNVVAPDRIVRTLEFDVGLYDAQTYVMFGQEDGTTDDGNPALCPYLRLVTGDGAPVEVGGEAVEFRGRYPLWTNHGTLAGSNPSIIYFAGAGDKFCSGVGAMETDPVALGPVSIDYDEDFGKWYDAN